MGTQRCGGAPSLKLKNHRKSYGFKHSELKNVVFHVVSGKKQALGHVLSETSREALDRGASPNLVSKAGFRFRNLDFRLPELSIRGFHGRGCAGGSTEAARGSTGLHGGSMEASWMLHGGSTEGVSKPGFGNYGFPMVYAGENQCLRHMRFGGSPRLEGAPVARPWISYGIR